MKREESIAAEKAGLRTTMIAERKLLDESLRSAMSRSIARRVASLPEVQDARHIHLYLSIPGQAEVSTVPLLETLVQMHKRLSVPVVNGDELISSSFCFGDPLIAAAFGQPEPARFAAVDESDIDLVLVPLLAFDSRGYRIGYGKGYYDRFLQRLALRGCSAGRIGLAFSMQMVDEVPADPWDEPLDGVVHEYGIIRFT